MRVPERFATPVCAALDPVVKGSIGVAVSGGSDSVALLFCVRDWAGSRGHDVRAVTVDHRLRPEAADEARNVADLCGALGIRHDVLTWTDWDGQGNLQAKARDARRDLISAWAKEAGVSAVAVGHTMDDQAETVLMRLARGSGVDGLAGMSAVSSVHGVDWVRPLLGLRREDLRDLLRSEGVSWVEDPGNMDPHYERVRCRALLSELSRFGVDVERLSDTAGHMGRARDALNGLMAQVMEHGVTRTKYGETVLQRGVLEAGSWDLRYRLVSALLCEVSGNAYRPRFGSLKKLVADLLDADRFAGATLSGCVVRRNRTGITFRREPASIAPDVAGSLGVWDRRWIWDADRVAPNATVGGMREDEISTLVSCGDRPPREVLATLPALREGGRLLATPLAGMDNGTGFALKTLQQGFNTMTILR